MADPAAHGNGIGRTLRSHQSLGCAVAASDSRQRSAATMDDHADADGDQNY